MRDPLHDRRLAAQEPIIGIALVTAATVALGVAAWVLSLLVALVF
ncbi:MAG: hypothetical protein ACRDUY_09815 [Nitriliruptorales bacterium]